MDPAGPGFQKAENDSKLTSDDAKYVQCIYTNGGTWGTETEHGDGHGNFFMHGGIDQPGCEDDIFDICDHSLAYMYFKESLDKSHVFEGADCRDGKGNLSHTDRIGIHSKMENGKFCVKVNKAFPYAKGILKNKP